MKKSYYIIIELFIITILLTSCLNVDTNKKIKLTVYHAGSLSVPLAEIEKEFEKKYPNIDVVRTSGGSRTIARKITDLNNEVDVLLSADYNVINALVIPEFADYNILFAKNSMVIMYSEDSKLKDKITQDNWYKILTEDGVEFGYSDPNSDPCGYRSVLLWQLAEKYYNEKGLNQKFISASKEKNIRPKAVELISLLEAGEVDYIFEYESVAIQHAKSNSNLKFIKLPEKINLSNLKYKDFYKTALIELNGKDNNKIERKGEAIIYGLTIPKTYKHKKEAIEFINFLLSKEGKNIFLNNGQPLLDEIKVINSEKLPKDFNFKFK